MEELISDLEQEMMNMKNRIKNIEDLIREMKKHFKKESCVNTNKLETSKAVNK